MRLVSRPGGQTQHFPECVGRCVVMVSVSCVLLAIGRGTPHSALLSERARRLIFPFRENMSLSQNINRVLSVVRKLLLVFFCSKNASSRVCSITVESVLLFSGRLEFLAAVQILFVSLRRGDTWERSSGACLGPEARQKDLLFCLMLSFRDVCFKMRH
jgi:hypothetical protein